LDPTSKDVGCTSVTEDCGCDGVDIPPLELFLCPAALADQPVVVTNIHGEPKDVGGGLDAMSGPQFAVA
jgi:hypothetical protein